MKRKKTKKLFSKREKESLKKAERGKCQIPSLLLRSKGGKDRGKE